MTERFETEGMTLLAIHERHRHGFHLAFAPQFLASYELNTALQELGLEPHDLQLFEVCNWRSTESGVAIAFVPFPRVN